MNFGKKITVLYLCFVALIITMVMMCFGQKVELVSSDYYAKELKFQDQITAVNNEKELNKSINHFFNKKTITLILDSNLMTANLQGTVTFFRPSDSSKDLKIKMNFKNGKQIIDKNNLLRGVYKLQLNWTSNGKNYYKEDEIFIN
jgi:nitrogen fixation protein FixH